MSTTISILGGVGLFLLGMTVMTDGLKALAGSALRTVLAKAAATPMRGAFWGAIATLLVQSSSATTMTTIGLVSAGLLTFPQGLGLVFGANVGTTGTGWLVALIGVRVSLTAAALPMIFIGALLKLLGRGRVSAAGAALAGFALVLFGLTTLQQGMEGLAERPHPADLPAVLSAPGVPWWSSLLGVLILVAVGLVMTAVMQSSTAAIAVTLSAQYTGAIGLDQLPLMDQFTRFVERMLPERTSALTRCLDPAALATPIAAVEAVRRTVAGALILLCTSLDNALEAASRGEAVRSGKDAVSVPEAADALRQAQIFMSDVSGPPESEDEQRRLTNTLHALEHASRLAEVAGEKAEFTAPNGGPDDVRASRLCADAMRSAVVAVR